MYIYVYVYIHIYRSLGHPFELRSPRIPPGACRCIKEGQHQPWERMEACMGVRLLGRAMLGQLVVVAINYDFVRTVKS